MTSTGIESHSSLDAANAIIPQPRAALETAITRPKPSTDRRDARYIVPASWGDGSTWLTMLHSGRSFGVTFAQCAPASRETCTRPSSVPTQRRPFSLGDSAIAKIVQ